MRAAQLQTSSAAEKSLSDCCIKRPQHANSRQTQSDEGPMETGRNFKKKKSVYRTGHGETFQQNIEIISNGLNNHISIPAEMKGGEQVLPAHFQPPSALIPWKN